MESAGEKIGVGIAVPLAGLLTYATFPGFQALIMPSAPPLWDPVLSASQSVSIIGAIIGLGLLLAAVNRLRSARATGNPVVPVLVWVILFAIVAAAITAFVAVLAFEITYQSMLGIGVNSSAALIVGLLVGGGTWLMLSRK